MKYYAHTAELPDGTRLPEESGKWQLLAEQAAAGPGNYG